MSDQVETNTYYEPDTAMLDKVNLIGMNITDRTDTNLIFLDLIPYLGRLTNFLKNLPANDMAKVFAKYEGVKRVMQMIERSAQQLEQEMAEGMH